MVKIVANLLLSNVFYRYNGVILKCFLGSLGLMGGCGGGSDYTTDPLAHYQWYLTGKNGDAVTAHINALHTPYAGNGVVIAIVDNGVDTGHEDLRNQFINGSYSYLPESYEFSDADHGTAVAGIIVAQLGNGLGIQGIAHGAKIMAFNALRAPSISNLADALVRNKETVWVSSNSWGDFNSWGEPLPLRSLLQAALEDGTRLGRHGKGIVYVFSAGNGNAEKNNLPTDNVNYSGLVNNRFTIPVCAVDENGKKTSYSEIGATLLVCAPSKGHQLGITTTDARDEWGYNPKVFLDDYEQRSYTKNFSGTSASAPMVSGVVALILEANPNLSWRDVRGILAKSASKVDRNHADWQLNNAGLWVNHSYGFGLINARNAIDLAKNWKNYPALETVEVGREVNSPIPDGSDVGLRSVINIEDNFNIEFIDVFFDAPDHERLGDLEINLYSPSGTVSQLAELHHSSFSGFFRYNNWRFGSMRHLDEKSSGDWTLEVKDRKSGEVADLRSWRIKIYGHR